MSIRQHSCPCVDKVDTNLIKQKKFIVQQIFEKLQELDAKERRLLDLLAVPATTQTPLIHQLHQRDSTRIRGVCAVSIPTREGARDWEGGTRVFINHADGTISETGATAASTDATTTGVSAPAVQDTFEVASGWGGDDRLLHFKSPDGNNRCNTEITRSIGHRNADSDSSTHGLDDNHCGELNSIISSGQGLRLLQCAVGPREGVLQYKKELKRCVCACG